MPSCVASVRRLYEARRKPVCGGFLLEWGHNKNTAPTKNTCRRKLLDDHHLVEGMQPFLAATIENSNSLRQRAEIHYRATDSKIVEKARLDHKIPKHLY